MNFDFRFFWNLFLKRLPLMMAAFLICAGSSVFVAINTPKSYSTSATLLVEEPQIQSSGALSENAGVQLEVIQQRLMTRANLIDIANNRNVLPDEEDMTPDEVLDLMRATIDISRSSGRDRATVMQIQFENGDPQTAADVVNDLVTIVLNDNARQRTRAAEGKLAFFEQEVQRLGIDLDAQSERILVFKSSNAGALPDSLSYRRDRVDLLQERVARLERESSGLQEQRGRIIQVYQATGRLQSEADERMSPTERRLLDLEAQLSQALSVFSENNPRVKLLQNQVDRQRELFASESAGLVAEGGGDGAEGSEDALLQISLAQLDTQLESIEIETTASNEELVVLQESIAKTSANQIALDALERDYENIQGQYNAAVDRLNEARVGERIEVSSRGQRITVIENANVPTVPSGPSRRKIVAAGVGAGLLAMAAIFFLLETLNRTIRRPAELVSALGVTPIAAIPYIESASRRFARRSFQVTSFLVVLVGVPLGLWLLDQYYLPLNQIADQLIDRLL
ncbi:MAG: lipopolysaccharide biosynthesis [Pseudomonadota bacterium]